MRYHPEFIEFFHIGKHCLGVPSKGENRWVYFPLSESLEKGKKYRLEYEIKSNKAMKRVFFLVSGSDTQTLDIQISADEWINSTIEFTANLESINNLCITATDLPVVGNAFFVRSLRILIENQFLKKHVSLDDNSVYALQQRLDHAEQRANEAEKWGHDGDKRANELELRDQNAELRVKGAEQRADEVYNELDSIKRSVSFRLGRMVTFIPRKIRDIFRK